MIVAQVRISAEAENDIGQIAAYTAITWGWRQTNKYLTKLEDCFELLAGHPSVGRTCDSIRVGLRRFEIGSHVIFYFPEEGEILIVRVLHEHMLPANYM